MGALVRETGLEPAMMDLEAIALATKLLTHIKVAPVEGFEPPTSPLYMDCSFSELHGNKKVGSVHLYNSPTESL